MVAKEYCCYTRPYSRIEGFQLAHTLYYSASVEEEGVVLALHGCKWAAGERKACTICGICWF